MSYPRAALAFVAGNVLGGSVAILFFYRNPMDKSSATTEASKDSYFKYGYPKPSTTFHNYNEHSLIYDNSKRIPLWVSETLTRRSGPDADSASRSKCIFRPDPAIPAPFRSSNADYSKSGWSRGHMAAAGNRKHSQQAMDDTFFLTNIIPQDVDNNSGYWNRLEMFCRSLTKQFDKVHIISGPLFMPKLDEKSKKKFVKYEVN